MRLIDADELLDKLNMKCDILAFITYSFGIISKDEFMKAIELWEEKKMSDNNA